jgi:HAD superfamily hydrolase (TIGR01549 family)
MAVAYAGARWACMEHAAAKAHAQRCPTTRSVRVWTAPPTSERTSTGSGRARPVRPAATRCSARIPRVGSHLFGHFWHYASCICQQTETMPSMPPLMLFDLDNTLVDRDRAFRAWALTFLTDRSLPPADLDWLVTLDCGGYLDRQILMDAACERYGLGESTEILLKEYRETLSLLVDLPTANREALRAARSAGWTLGIVSNGATAHQLAKIERTGLPDLVDGWVISEEAGYAKPDPRIFRLAAQRCGALRTDWTADAWMVGDHPPADIVGAAVSGLHSVWLDHGRPWPETVYRPTLTSPTLPGAVRLILDSTGAPAQRRTTGSGQHLAPPSAPLRAPNASEHRFSVNFADLQRGCTNAASGHRH